MKSHALECVTSDALKIEPNSLVLSQQVLIKYRMNVQQILFKIWILATLHVYFVLHNIKEKMFLPIFTAAKDEKYFRICFLLL